MLTNNINLKCDQNSNHNVAATMIVKKFMDLKRIYIDCSIAQQAKIYFPMM